MKLIRNLFRRIRMRNDRMHIQFCYDVGYAADAEHFEYRFYRKYGKPSGVQHGTA